MGIRNELEGERRFVSPAVEDYTLKLDWSSHDLLPVSWIADIGNCNKAVTERKS